MPLRSPDWFAAVPHPVSPPADLLGWLQEPGSLTVRLARRWPDVAVRVLSEGLARPHPDEALRLRMGADALAWVRCVQLVGGGAVRLRARTVIPHWGHANPWADVQLLGTRPLGELLFGLPGGQRSGFEWCSEAAPAGGAVWSRRCVHTHQGAALLLTETFVDVIGPA